MNEHDIPVERVYDGDVMTLGESDAVTLTVIQELRESWPLNDQQATTKTVRRNITLRIRPPAV